MRRHYPMHSSPRCGARTRQDAPCRAPAMPNGRCRMHGGKSRAGAAHGRYTHGERTREAMADRRWLRELIARAEETLTHI